MKLAKVRIAASLFIVNAVFSAGIATNLNCAYAAGPVPAPVLAPGRIGVKAFTFSGPFMHDNLCVYLIHGKNSNNGQKIITLQEALAQQKVVIKETSNVNQLSIQNLGNVAVFIQGGDIVKGGKQDRTLQSDMILPPNSGVIPISVFCVEHGRWSKRGGESDQQFASASNGLASKQLKMAAKFANSQTDVWNKVEEMQSKAASNAKMSGPMASPASPSSLELTLESPKLVDSTREYLKDLAKLPDGKRDVIGYAFAINGKVNSADVYASNELFTKLWPKLLNSSAVEAFSERQEGKKFAAVRPEEVKSCMLEAENGKSSPKQKSGRAQLELQQDNKTVLFRTTDSLGTNGDVHLNYLTK